MEIKLLKMAIKMDEDKSCEMCKYNHIHANKEPCDSCIADIPKQGDEWMRKHFKRKK